MVQHLIVSTIFLCFSLQYIFSILFVTSTLFMYHCNLGLIICLPYNDITTFYQWWSLNLWQVHLFLVCLINYLIHWIQYVSEILIAYTFLPLPKMYVQLCNHKISDAICFFFIFAHQKHTFYTVLYYPTCGILYWYQIFCEGIWIKSL